MSTPLSLASSVLAVTMLHKHVVLRREESRALGPGPESLGSPGPCSNQQRGSIPDELPVTGSRLFSVRAPAGYEKRAPWSCHCKCTPARSFRFHPAQQAFIYRRTVVRTLSLWKPCLSPVPYLSLFLGRLSDLASSCLSALISVLISLSFLSLSILNTSPILCSLSLIHPSWMDQDIYLLKKENSLPKTLIQSKGCDHSFFLFSFFLMMGKANGTVLFSEFGKTKKVCDN